MEITNGVNKTKINSSGLLLAIIFIIFAVGPSPIALSQGSDTISSNQLNYVFTISQPSVAINQGDSFNLTVKLTLDGNNVDNAYFEIVDANDIIIVDIGETQIYNGNGNYTLIFTSNSTNEIIPGNYNSIILAHHNSEVVTVDFAFNIAGLDTIAPILTVISPENLTNFNETIFKIILEVTDDIFWKDIRIDIGDLNLYYLKNTINTSLDLPDLTYNATFLHLGIWINLPGIENLNASEFSITVRDGSFNKDVFGFELTGDYIKPILSWVSHQPDQVISSRNITLEWKIIEQSSIKAQILQLNGKLFQPGGIGIGSDDRTINFIVPIQKDVGQILEFSLLVTDEYDNTNYIELRLIYDPIEAEEDGLTDNFSFDSDNGVFALYGFLGLIVIGGIIFIYRKLSKGKSDKIPKGFLKLLNDRPSIDLSVINITREIEIEIIEILDEFNISEIEKDMIQFNLNNMKGKFEYIIYQYPENEELKNLIETKYFNWIDELSRRL